MMKSCRLSIPRIVALSMNLSLVLLYFNFSIGITFYQKWLINDFHFPLVVVTGHLLIKYLFAGSLRMLYQIFTGKPRTVVRWPDFIKKIAPTGIASAFDIGFSNWSFEYVTVSLYTMTKSTCIIFILGFSILFGLERKRPSLVMVVMLIALGLFMFTYHSTQFHIQGFLLALSASFLAGLRWTLSQLIMQRQDLGLSNPIDMMYHIQPWMLVGLFPLAIYFEGIEIATSRKMFRFQDYTDLKQTLIYISFGAILAFCMELSEYLLIINTSSLTLSIAGIFKEVCTLFLAVSYNGDQMTSINLAGLGLCLLGIAVHILLKTRCCDKEDVTETVVHPPSPNLIVKNE